jgi:hypothetical protein
MSLVFQNIHPPSPSPPGECVPPPLLVEGGGRGHTRRAERGVGGHYFGRRDIGLPSYSNNLSTTGRNRNNGKMIAIVFQLLD